MYIAPQGTIRLLTGVPLEPSFDHTIYFDTAAEQARWFIGKTKVKNNIEYVFTNQQYTRKGRGVIRIEKRVEELYDCNYMMFRNDGFAPSAYTKWFYAFITDVEYLNNEVSEVYFELDPMQTWFFDYQLEECFVEREHTPTDEIGDNIVEEKINIGQYTYVDEGKVPYFDNYSVVIATGCKPQTGLPPIDSDPGFYNGLFAGVEYISFDLSSQNVMSDLDYALHAIKTAGRTDEIVGIYMMPTAFVTQRSDDPTLSPTEYSVSMAGTSRIWRYKKDGVLTSPRNNKLYTYPFSALYISSSDGEGAVYKAEYWSKAADRYKFKLQGAMGCPPQIQITPYGYNFTSMNEQAASTNNYNECLTLCSYPMCSWTSDTYKAWLAQNKGKLIPGFALLATGLALSSLAIPQAAPIASSATALVPATLTEGAGIGSQAVGSAYSAAFTQRMAARGMGLAAGGASEIANNISSAVQAAAMPNQVQGVDRGVISLATRELGFHMYTMRVRDEYAAIIDSYFDRFGYAAKTTKIPNRNVRPHWTYTKTTDCTITGTLPSSEAAFICGIYNKGITFWKNGDEVGNYSLDNSPTTQQNNE